MSHATPTPLKASRSGGLTGTFQVPGDKSISHRALMLGAVSIGETTISGLLESADIHGTARAMAAFGARVERHQDGRWTVNGLGTGGLMEPKMPIDFGNAGTGVRLAIGLASTCPIQAKFTGDQSLCKRPMGRIMDPLSQFGTRFEATDGDRLPLQMTGATSPIPQEYTLPVASAQVKSALLLGALNVPGRTTVVEPVPTRDHTERMLAAFGADLDIKHTERGREVSLNGPAELSGQAVTVPADPSSAAFPMVAALITEGSDITLPNMMMNETRTGLLGVLRRMGGDIEVNNTRFAGVAHLNVSPHTLQHAQKPGAGLVHHHVGQADVGPLGDQRGHHGECRRGRICGHRYRLAAQLSRAIKAYFAAAFSVLDVKIRSKRGEHPLRVVAGGDRLHDRGAPRHIERAQQKR